MLKIFSLVLLLYDYENALAEKVIKKTDIEDFQNIKVLKKIKSLTPIDDDLALKIKKEISEGKELLNTVNNKLTDVNEDEMSHVDLLKKVERVLNLFNISDLDEIVNVKQIGGNFLDREESIYSGETEIVNREATEKHEDMRFNMMSTEIHSLDKLLEKLLNGVKKKKDFYENEKRVTVALAKMLKAQSKKINLIQRALSKHSDNAVRAHKEIQELFNRIRELQVEKIENLDKLRSMAENKENEALELIHNSQSQSNTELESVSEFVDENKNLELVGPDGEEEDSELEEIDSSKYNVFPLKKILSMKRIKSIVELTDEQARKLKNLQNLKPF